MSKARPDFQDDTGSFDHAGESIILIFTNVFIAFSRLPGRNVSHISLMLIDFSDPTSTWSHLWGADLSKLARRTVHSLSTTHSSIAVRVSRSSIVIKKLSSMY